MHQKAHSRFIVTLAVLLCASIVGYLSQTIFATGLPIFMSEFAIDAGMAQWVSTSYSVVLAVMIPPTAYITHRFTTRQVVLSSLALLTIGSVAGFFAQNFAVLVVARVLQAAGTGVLYPYLQIAIFKVLPQHRWQLAMGIVGLIVCVAPTIGPTLGGILIDSYGWRFVFAALTATSCIMAAVAFVATRNLTDTTKNTLDFTSLVQSVVPCVGIIVSFSNISSFGIASPLVWVPLVIGVLTAILFVRRQRRLASPFLNLSVFKNLPFNIGTLLNALMNFVSLGITLVVPIYAQSICGYSASLSGMLSLPSAIAMAAGSLLGGILAEKIGVRRVTLVSSATLCVGMAGMAFFDFGTPIWVIMLFQALRGLGLGLSMQVLTTWSLAAVDDLVEDATSASSTLKQIVGAMGSAVMAMLFSLFAGGTIQANEASVVAFQMINWVGFGLSVVCLVIALVFVKSRVANAKTQATPKTPSPIEFLIDRNPLSISANATVPELVELLATNKLNGVPVLGAEEHVAGFVTDGDLLSFTGAHVAHTVDATYEVREVHDSQTFAERCGSLMQLQVKDIATRNVVSVEPDATVDEVFAVLSKRKIKKIPVIDQGRLVGTISRDDAVRHLMDVMVTLGAREQDTQEAHSVH
ncbi:MAG: MFS transporter [Gordonibacter sp.]|uniref:MFS transporter n=1 Tax=Gordonibacter sp. TaxID=1968902 RepID=UPI002FCC7389